MAGRKGDISELQACSWLLSKGYEVFRNVSGVGPADIVVWKDKELTLIDVKTVRTTHKYPPRNISLQKHQVKLGVVPLFVSDKNISFKIDEVQEYISED